MRPGFGGSASSSRARWTLHSLFPVYTASSPYPRGIAAIVLRLRSDFARFPAGARVAHHRVRAESPQIASEHLHPLRPLLVCCAVAVQSD